MALFFLGFMLGSTMGGLLNTLLPAKVGFWNQETRNTDLRITLLRHIILNPTQIRTTIQLNNIGPYSTSANVTIFYRNASGESLVTYCYNITINTGATNTKAFIVTLSVEQWINTDISIEEL